MPYLNVEDQRKAEQRSYYKKHDANKKRKLASYYKNRDSRLIKCKENYEKLKSNPEAHSKRKKQWNAARLLKQYGLTEEQFLQMKEAQNNKCVICNKEFDDTSKNTNACVDHCHTTNNVRGLLCGYCNSALGMLKENVESMKNMITYVEKTSMYFTADIR